MDLTWIFLNITFLFHYSNTCCSITHIGVVTPVILTESSGYVLKLLVPVNDVGLLWKWKWLFPIMSALSELVRSYSLYLNSSISAFIVVKVFFVWLFRFPMLDLLELLDRLALYLSPSFYFFCCISYCLLENETLGDLICHTWIIFSSSTFYHRSSCLRLGPYYHPFEKMLLPQKWVGSL